MVGGYARAVDLISAEYGWTDDIILDSPIRRIRQINEVIKERRSLDDYKHKSYLEWQTKVLASFFAVSAQSEKGAKAVQEAAEAISITGKTSKKDDRPTLDHLPPDDSPNAERNAERNKRIAEGGGSAGQFEKMQGMFGGGGLLRGGPG